MVPSHAKVVTIDGPAASGKTSVSRELAKRWHWNWVSTGAFYRGLAYVAQTTKTPLDDEAALSRLSVSPEWGVRMAEDRTQVFFQGHNVTDQIYSEDVGSAASRISHYPKVRNQLLQAQRDCAKVGPGLVAEGRDCGTVVFPEADVKIYLTARSESRAERRALEQGSSVEEMKVAQQVRDTQDSTRKTAPLQVPENSYVIDTSELTLSEVVDQVDSIVRKKISL